MRVPCQNVGQKTIRGNLPHLGRGLHSLGETLGTAVLERNHCGGTKSRMRTEESSIFHQPFSWCADTSGQNTEPSCVDLMVALSRFYRANVEDQ